MEERRGVIVEGAGGGSGGLGRGIGGGGSEGEWYRNLYTINTCLELSSSFLSYRVDYES